MSSLLNLQSVEYKNPLQLIEMRDQKTYKDIYARGQALLPGIHFFVKIWMFRVSYFLWNSYETSRIN